MKNHKDHVHTVEESPVHLRERIDAAQERLADLYEGANKKVVAGAKYTDAKIHENAYWSLAIVFGVGLLVGVLAGRCKR